MEAREAEAEAKALKLVQDFTNTFRSVDFSIHPAGKGSNLAWAARKLSAKYTVAMRPNVIVTVIDGEIRERHSNLRWRR